MPKTLNEVAKAWHPMTGATGIFNATYQHRLFANGEQVKLLGPGLTSSTYRAVGEQGKRGFVNADDVEIDQEG